MAKEGRESVPADFIGGRTGEVITTGEVDVCCEPHFVASVGNLLEKGREVMRGVLYGDGGNVTKGSTAAFRAGWEGIVWDSGQVGDA